MEWHGLNRYSFQSVHSYGQFERQLKIFVFQTARHGPRNDFVVGGGTRANYTKYISIQNVHYILGVWAEPQPTNDLVHFSLKVANNFNNFQS